MSDFNVTEFLVGELGFTAEEAATIAPQFTGDRATKLKGTVLRQADYSRKMNELQTSIGQKEQQLQQEMAEWASLTAAEKAASQGLREQLERTQREHLQAQQALTRLAQEAGVDPKTYLGTEPPPAAPPTPPAPTVDTSKFATGDQLAQIARLSLQIPAQIAVIANEHRRLTGEELDPTALVAELEARAQTRGNTKPLDLRAIWEEQHNIPTLRDQKAQEKYNADIAAAEARGRERALTEQSLPPGAMPAGRHAPVFGNRQSSLQRPQPGQGLQAAIAALRTRKYASPGNAGTPSA